MTSEASPRQEPSGLPGDYETVDLTDHCNAGIEAVGGHPISAGDHSYHGLPFSIGGQTNGQMARLLLLEPGAREIEISVGRPVSKVIVAHRRIPEEPDAVVIGETVAVYRFELEGATVVEVPIRERFEIGVLAPDGWDHWDSPFLAVSGGREAPMDRYRGRWGESGYRQTEAPWRDYQAEFFLWSWDSPEPDAILSSIRLAARGGSVVVGAITTSTADEHPLLRDAAVPVQITVHGEPSNRDLTLDVDRGVSSYLHPLPDQSLEDYLSDSLSAWGEPRTPASTRYYSRVAALPSATLTIRDSGEELDRLRWDEVKSGDSVEGARVRIEMVESGRTWVHVEVVDDGTGRPVPCRVHFRSPAGVPYQPHGHHDHVNSDLDTWHIDVGGDVRLGRLSYAYIDGTCQGWLPTGEVIVDVARGFEYEPLREVVHIEKGQRELNLRLRRWTEMNARGWYSGDSHVHFLSASGALAEQQGEDLNVVNLLQSQWGSLFTNTEDFTGRPHAAEGGRYVTYVSQENRQHFLGHLILWGLKQPVMPWCSDGLTEAETGGSLEITESEWADECHAQGGTVVIPHFPWPNGEPAVLIATGRADAVEMIMQRHRSHEEYYRYLNAGYRLPLVGGTDKMSSEVPVGLYRTYARLGDEEFSYDGWCAAVRAGRTFLSGGPILSFSVEGFEIGDMILLKDRGTVNVSAAVESIFPVASLEVLRNGEVVAETSESGGSRQLNLTAEVPIDGDSWLAARCGGPGYYDGLSHLDVWNRGIFAHTSPIYVTTGEEWAMSDPTHDQYMMTLVEGGLAYIQHRAARYPEGYASHHHGEADHLAHLERPFREALDALQQRIAESGTRLP